MRRGFKAWAEEQAAFYRRDLGLSSVAPLPAERLAGHLEVTLITPSEVPGITSDVLDVLLTNDTSGWSALTVQVEEQAIVVYNVSHAPARQESDLMHELAHIICKHPAMRLVKIARTLVREYSEIQEEEATWLGGCLHLPRIALLNAIRRGLTTTAIAQQYIASEAMVKYRRNVTGIDVQAARMSRSVDR